MIKCLFTSRTAWVAVTAAALTSFAMSAPARAADNEIVLGAAISLSGPVASSGILQRNALEMAAKKINEGGGINGKQVRLVFEDTQFSNSVAVNAYLKLVKQHSPPFIFMNSVTGQALAIESLVAREKIPTMYAGGGIKLRERKNAWMFRIRPADTVQAMGMVDAVVNRFKAKKVAIGHVQDEFGTGAATIVSEMLKKQGIQIVATETWNATDSDMSAQVLNIKNSGAEILLVLGYNRDGALVAKQRKSLGLTIPAIFNTALAQVSTLKLVEPSDLEGVFAATDAVIGPTISPESEAFGQEFQKLTGLWPDSFEASYYDGLMIVAKAIATVGADPTKIRDYLMKVKDFKGVTRTYNTDANLDMAHTSVLISFKPGTKDKVVEATFQAPMATSAD